MKTQTTHMKGDNIMNSPRHTVTISLTEEDKEKAQEIKSKGESYANIFRVGILTLQNHYKISE